jgi:hypothetical protein
VEGEWWLSWRLDEPCPLGTGGRGSTLAWVVASTVLFPVGIPLVLYAVLRYQRLPKIAKGKQDNALLAQMIAAFLNLTANCVASRVHALLTLMQDQTSSSRHEIAEIILRRHGADFDGTLRITRDGICNFLDDERIQFEVGSEEQLEFERLFAAEDRDKLDALTVEELEVSEKAGAAVGMTQLWQG